MASNGTQTAAIEAAKVALAAQNGNGRTGRAPTTEEMAQADAAGTAKGHSPKHRAVRGVPEGWSTTWVPVDVPPARAELMERVVKARNAAVPESAEGQKKKTVKVVDLYNELIKAALDAPGVLAGLEAEAAKAPDKAAASLAAMTPEKLQKRINDSQAQLDRAKAMLEAARAKQAEQKS